MMWLHVNAGMESSCIKFGQPSSKAVQQHPHRIVRLFSQIILSSSLCFHSGKQATTAVQHANGSRSCRHRCRRMSFSKCVFRQFLFRFRLNALVLFLDFLFWQYDFYLSLPACLPARIDNTMREEHVYAAAVDGSTVEVQVGHDCLALEGCADKIR